MSSSGKVKAKIYPGAVVCQEAEIKGPVTIGTKTVIHPKAKIFADQGPIVIGENNLIEEQTLIWNTHPGKTMTIGNQNVFEIGAQSQALYIGDNNILECKAKVGADVQLSDGCVIGAMCELDSVETLPQNTVIYGTKSHRRQASEKPLPQTLQLDFLTKVLPNYHHLKKPMKQ